MEAEASTYQVPKQDEPAVDDDAETISSMSTADYNREEVEGSLTTISEAIHTIAQEYEKLRGIVPHMSKVQAAQVIVRLLVLPILKQEIKKEKAEVAEVIEVEPAPGTLTEQPTAGSEKSTKQTTREVMEEQIVEREDDESNKGSKDEYFQRYMLTGKGKNPEEKVQQACKEINFLNLIVLIAVGDYIVNQVRNIKEAAKKWGLSFSLDTYQKLKRKSYQQNTDQEMPPTPRLDPPTIETVPQPMRPEPDLGTPLKVKPRQDNRRWQVPGQGSATKFGPFQGQPILLKERTLKAKTKQR